MDFENMKTEPINVVERLGQGVSFAEVMKQVPATAFEHRPGCLCCSDGRFAPQNSNLEKAGMAGQGILLLFNEAELNQFIENLKQNPDKPGIIASHEACGAANLAFKGIKDLMVAEKDEEVARIFAFLGIAQLPATSDELGVVYTKRLAELTGADYEHLDLSPEKADHNESGIIVTDLNFDENAIKVGDQQFFNSVSAKLGLSDGYLKTELTKLTEIAFGGHGRMSHHTDENFYLLLISSAKQAARLEAIAREVAANPSFSGRVKVEVFVRE